MAAANIGRGTARSSAAASAGVEQKHSVCPKAFEDFVDLCLRSIFNPLGQVELLEHDDALRRATWILDIEFSVLNALGDHLDDCADADSPPGGSLANSFCNRIRH
ncbi:MAG: hypothetical protein OSA47_11635, partial [Novosphingopyxis baekryungensis]|nr:hypothetical protein [Novosphingopyxis baekryungensis]